MIRTPSRSDCDSNTERVSTMTTRAPGITPTIHSTSIRVRERPGTRGADVGVNVGIDMGIDVDGIDDTNDRALGADGGDEGESKQKASWDRTTRQ